MPRFIIHLSEKKQKQKLFLAWFFMIMGCLFFMFDLLFHDKLLFRGSFTIALFGILIGIDGFRNMGRVSFVEVNERYIEWSVMEKSTIRIFIEWSGVRWIKKEKDGSMSVYQDSSFSSNLPLTALAEKDGTEILHLLEQYATEKKIPLVNFSEPVLATA